MKDNNNKTTRRDRLRKLRAGIQDVLAPALQKLTIAGEDHDVADILAAIDADIARSDASEKSRAVWLQAVEDEKASHRALDPVVTGVERFVRLHFGDGDAQQAILAQFGLSPRATPVVPPATRVAAAEKARATRALLHTRGPRQKAKAKADAEAAKVPAKP
jgi:hypothetical protein